MNKLSRREMFAAFAMSGELASQSDEHGIYMSNKRSASILAKRSVLFADALIAALDGETNSNNTIVTKLRHRN